MRAKIAGAWASLVSVAFAHAALITVDVDPAQTKINWVLAGNVHTVHGSFALKSGHVSLDPVTGVISGELVADAASGDSGNQTRDKRMHKEILESARFGEIKLRPKKIEGAVALTGRSTVRVSGDFLVHGSTHAITVPMQITVSGTTLTGKGKFSIPYVDWGMKDPSNFLFKVDKSVEIEVVATGRVSAGAPE